MRYEYIESIDKYYKQLWKNANQAVKEAGFLKEEIYEGNVQYNDMKYPNCVCCRSKRYVKEYPLKPQTKTFMSMTVYYSKEKDKHEVRGNVCIHCLLRLHDKIMQLYGFNPFQALAMVCAITNHYYDDKFARMVYMDDDRVYREILKPVSEEASWVDLYFREVYKQEGNKEKDFWGSEDAKPLLAMNFAIDDNEMISEEDKQNADAILATYHYDPFVDDDPKDKPKLRTWLVAMIDDAMKEDFIRMQAALEVVRSFYRMEKWDKNIKELENDGIDGAIVHANDIKKITEMKAKESKTVSEFARDNGFTEKYQMAKSKGSGTMSAIVRDMETSNYDFGVINRYDIETAAAIKQVSDISAESIFKQLNLQAADYVDMVKEQSVEIVKLREELSSAKEELRLFKEKELKQELLQELKEELISKGIPTANVDEMIHREYHLKKEVPV